MMKEGKMIISTLGQAIKIILIAVLDETTVTTIGLVLMAGCAVGFRMIYVRRKTG
jgi:hypothetical protein